MATFNIITTKEAVAVEVVHHNRIAIVAMFYKLGPWSTILTDNFWWSFLLRKKIVIITIIIVIIIIIIIIIITISLLSSSSSLSLLSSLLLGYWQKNAGILWEEEMQNTHYGKSTSLNAEFYTSASVFAKYTERQINLSLL